MKTKKLLLKNLFLLPALIACLGLMMSGRVTAQTLTTLHNFDYSGLGEGPGYPLILSGNTLYGTEPGAGTNGAGTIFSVNTNGSGFKVLYTFTACSTNSSGIVTYGIATNSDGALPGGGLILSGSILYGTAAYGGKNGSGTVFAINTNGTGFTNLHNFAATFTNSNGVYTNSDGASPQTGLILSGNTLYGTAVEGGTNGCGTVFAINTNGTGFTNLYSFSAIAGDFGENYPNGGLILSGNTLYGTVQGSGSWNGAVFAINTNGSGFTNLYSFSFFDTIGGTNNDGADPNGGLILSGNTLYGTAEAGGIYGFGTVFSINTNGSGFRILHNFKIPIIDNDYTSKAYDCNTNSDGASPWAGLILSGNTLYGTASNGGTNGYGTVFAINIDETGFTTLHSFSAGQYNSFDIMTNSDGANPYAGLILSDNNLYGTTRYGGIAGNGAIFVLNTNGTGFTTLHSFSATNASGINSDGAYPEAGLILSGNTLYGTTTAGGTNGDGVVFSINTNGTCFTNLYSFAGGGDGANPYAGLTLSGNTLYGTALYRGTNGTQYFSGLGTVFSISLAPVSPIAPSFFLSAPKISVGRTNFTFLLSGPAGSNYVLQVSTNLSNWNPVSTSAIPVSGTINLTNAINNYNRRFYRAVIP